MSNANDYIEMILDFHEKRKPNLEHIREFSEGMPEVSESLWEAFLQIYAEVTNDRVQATKLKMCTEIDGQFQRVVFEYNGLQVPEDSLGIICSDLDSICVGERYVEWHGNQRAATHLYQLGGKIETNL